MKRLTASEARQNWFRLLDEVIAGESVVIERHGVRVVLRREAAGDVVPDYTALLSGAEIDGGPVGLGVERRRGAGVGRRGGTGIVNLLLDTHFLLWLLAGSSRLDAHSWLADKRPHGVSPISLLEIQFLHESGRIQARSPDLIDAIREDPRFVIDEPPLLSLVERALPLDWTRDPFDRLLCAHSELRRVPLCSLDHEIRTHHRLLSRELG